MTVDGGLTNTFAEAAGAVVIEAEQFTARSGANGNEWKIVPLEEVAGDNAFPIANPRGEYVQVLDDNGGFPGNPTEGAAIEYQVTVTTPGTYRLYTRWDANAADVGASDSIFVDLKEFKDGTGGVYPDWFEMAGANTDFASGPSNWDATGGNEVNNAGATPSTNVQWTIAAADIAANNGLFTIRYTPREDGAAIDALVLQLDSLGAPAGAGPAASTPVILGNVVIGPRGW